MPTSDQIILSRLDSVQPHDRTCATCGATFHIEPEDIEWYKKLVVPPPRSCPQCRFIRRIVFRNERHLYNTVCDATKRPMISMYKPNSGYTVYDKDYWWSDAWDARDYAVIPDLTKPVIPQFNDLVHCVPHYSLYNINNENSAYTNYANGIKNCYMSFLVYLESEDLSYCYIGYHSKNCIDCYNIEHCEWCYECFDSTNCYHCTYLYHSNGCSDCYYSWNLKNCTNCLLCTNLNNKQYCYKNQQLSKEDYEKVYFAMKKDEAMIQEFEKIGSTRIVKNLQMVNCTDCVGDYLTDSMGAIFCMGQRQEHTRYSWGPEIKNSCDAIGGILEFCYETCNTGWANSLKFCHATNNCNFCEYCVYCQQSHDLFGCVSLNHREYCIFNKQYTKEEYFLLVEKIKLAMIERGEYGEFLPVSMSPFGYNETLAQDFYPKTKEEALRIGYRWNDYDPESSYNGLFYTPHDDIEYYRDEAHARELLSGVLQCERSNKPYRMTSQELAFYLNDTIPIPRLCFEERHKRRWSRKVPYYYYTRSCGKCGMDMVSTYAPDRPEKVYCERCYQDEVF